MSAVFVLNLVGLFVRVGFATPPRLPQKPNEQRSTTSGLALLYPILNTYSNLKYFVADLIIHAVCSAFTGETAWITKTTFKIIVNLTYKLGVLHRIVILKYFVADLIIHAVCSALIGETAWIT